MGVLVQVARLFRAGKIELRTAELLDANGAFEALRNTHMHSNVRVRIEAQPPAEAIKAVKDFFHDFFNRTNPGTVIARSVAEATLEELGEESRQLDLFPGQKANYPFLLQLEPIKARLDSLVTRGYPYLLEHIGECSDLVNAKGTGAGPNQGVHERRPAGQLRPGGCVRRPGASQLWRGAR